MAREYLTLAEYARRTGRNYHSLYHCLRVGAVPMRDYRGEMIRRTVRQWERMTLPKPVGRPRGRRNAPR
jgi:hypothetical protein